MRRSSFILLFSLYSFAPAFSQDFLEGYLVKSNGDTLRGYISQSKSGKDIRIKSTAQSSDIQEFKPADLKGSFLKSVNEYYISGTFEVDMKPIDIRHLEENDPSPRFATQTVMLRVLMKGKASLYTLQDPIKQHFFFQIDNGAIREMMNIHYYDAKSASEVTMEGFKHQMKSQMPGCPVNYDLVYYSESSLLKAFRTYNTCKGVVTTAAPTARVTKKIFYLMTGVAINHGSYSQITKDFPDYTGFVFGAGLEFQPTKITNHFSLTTELFIKDFSSSMDNVPSTGGPASVIFKFNYLQLPVCVKYNFNGKIRPYIKAGPTINCLTNKEDTFTTSSASNVKVADFQNIILGFTAATGVSFGRVMVEGRYESTLLNAPVSQFHIQAGTLMAGYILYK